MRPPGARRHAPHTPGVGGGGCSPEPWPWAVCARAGQPPGLPTAAALAGFPANSGAPLGLRVVRGLFKQSGPQDIGAVSRSVEHS